MSDYTFRIAGVCQGGEHITVRILKDGVALQDKVINRSDILNTDLSWNDVLPFMLNKIIKTSGATTSAQRKVAIESAVISL